MKSPLERQTLFFLGLAAAFLAFFAISGFVLWFFLERGTIPLVVLGADIWEAFLIIAALVLTTVLLSAWMVVCSYWSGK